MFTCIDPSKTDSVVGNSISSLRQGSRAALSPKRIVPSIDNEGGTVLVW